MTNVSDANGTSFKRALNPKVLTEAALASYPLLGQLLALWSPAGHDSEDGKRLRLFIRDGYVNFYAEGQSVFMVSFGKDGLKFRIHRKYVLEDVPSADQGHLSISGDSFQADLSAWHDRARRHSSKKAEKVFVDLLLGANPDVIDVEAALPGVLVKNEVTGEESLVAPRMDLVALEPCAGGYRLVFWEAKLSDNPETRVRSPEDPEVVGQLGKYKKWLEDPAHKRAVIDAYTEACRMLVALHDLADAAPPLGQAILAVGSGRAEIVDLDPQIRLVIRESRKEGAQGGKKVRAFRDPAFTQNGHAQKLEKKGIPLLLIGPGGSFVLASDA